MVCGEQFLVRNNLQTVLAGIVQNHTSDHINSLTLLTAAFAVLVTEHR